MSLLRRLNEQAQQVKDAEAAQERARSDRKDRFAQITVPAMQALGVFLTEITEQLKVVRPPVQQSFELPGYGSFPTQCLFDFAVRVEPRYSEIVVELSWKSRVDTERAPRLVLNSFDRIRNLSELFKRLHLGGFKDEKRGPGGHVIACTLQASGFVNSKMTVVASLEDEVARFTFDNVDQLLITRQSVPITLFSDEMCERLGEFLLRENDMFIRDQWVRSLTPPAKPFRPALMDERAVAPLNAAPPITGPQSGVTPSLNIESGFSRAAAQRQDRDTDLMAELSEAARMAEEVVKRNIETGSMNSFSSERELGNVLSSAAGLADSHRQAQAIPSHSLSAPAPAPAKPAAPSAAERPVPAAAVPAAQLTPVAKAAPAGPLASAASPSPPAVARPLQMPVATPRGVGVPASSSAVVQPSTPAAPPAASPRPMAAPAAAPSVRPPVPVASAVLPAATPSIPLVPRANPAVPAAPAAAAPAPQPGPAEDSPGKPEVARSFMDRFQKMRSELERKP
jgi:hypothetical protein